MIARFVQEHLNDDTARLILDRAKWPEIDIDLAVNCIESRRKLKGKVQEWYENSELIFPLKLSAEQCSSSATGAYKAGYAESIFEQTTLMKNTAEGLSDHKMRLADLTGGYGVDSWSFSKVAEACSVIRSTVPKYKGFTQEDYTKTGLWLMDTLAKHTSR